jgi:Bax protein
MFVKLVSKILIIALVVLAAVYPVLNPPKSPTETSTDKESYTVVKNTTLPDFTTYTDVKEKKVAFFSYLTPYVEQINREVSLKRDFIQGINQLPENAKVLKKLMKIADSYDVDTDIEFVELKRRLLSKVDGLPLVLVLMQAANESAWGTSRFALEANNLFGQWCFKKGCGLIPSGRPVGKTYEVRKFKYPINSIRSYFHNLNTGFAYKKLRSLRAQLRKDNKKLDATIIADGLISYSTRREAYIAELKHMIRINKKYIKNQPADKPSTK